jgi:hypothetical protein
MMTQKALRAIVLHELDLIEETLTEDERISVAIEIACRLLSVPLVPPQAD